MKGVGVLIPLEANFLLFNLPFTTKQYEVDNIAKFVYYGRTLMVAGFDIFAKKEYIGGNYVGLYYSTTLKSGK